MIEYIIGATIFVTYVILILDIGERPANLLYYVDYEGDVMILD
jgi:hypothetical protein